MNLEEACRAADAAVYAKTGQHLSNVQICILQGALRGETYEQIASASPYSVSYVKKVAGPSLWSLLSQGLGEPVSKTNFQAALAQLMPTAPTPVLPDVWAEPPLVPVTAGSERSTPDPLSTLVGVPNTAVFFGRSAELTTLGQWLVEESVRLVLVSGMGGIGKTTLLARSMRRYHTEFAYGVMCTLPDAPILMEVLGELLISLGTAAETLPSTLPERLTCLEMRLKRQRCLLVLDNVETLLQRGALTGQYGQDYQRFGDWLQRLADDDHPSCVVLVGREQPSALVSLVGETLPVRQLKLRGLSTADAKHLLGAKGLGSAQPGIEDLIRMQRGNPLALQIIATTIQDLFGGNVAQFLKQETVLINDTLQHLLQEQFERLSTVEKGVMYWLALERQVLPKLRENTRFLISSPSEVLKTLQSLKRRSLLEEDTHPDTGEVVFNLQPLVWRYTINQLTADVLASMAQLIASDSLHNLGLFRSHLLFSEDPFYQLRHSQTRLVLQALLNQLQITLGDRKMIHQQLNQILLRLQDKPTQVIGYATTNLINLQRIIESQRL